VACTLDEKTMNNKLDAAMSKATRRAARIGKGTVFDQTLHHYKVLSQNL
jgi:hypothetical protein